MSIKGALLKAMSLRYVAGIIALLATAGGWQYLTPQITLHSIQDAARRGDLATPNELVDFSSVRDSVKESLKASYNRSARKELSDAVFAEVIAMMLGGFFIDHFVDLVASPSGIASLTTGELDAVS